MKISEIVQTVRQNNPNIQAADFTADQNIKRLDQLPFYQEALDQTLAWAKSRNIPEQGDGFTAQFEQNLIAHAAEYIKKHPESGYHLPVSWGGYDRNKGQISSLTDAKAPEKLCKSRVPDDQLGASQLASCKSQGLRARDSDDSYKIGGKRVKLRGKKIRGKKYGGPLPAHGVKNKANARKGTSK